MQVQTIFAVLASFFALGYVGVNALPDNVICKNAKGEAATFKVADCHQVSLKLAKGLTSKDSCGSCALALMNPSTKHLFHSTKPIELKRLTDAVDKVLAACSSPAHHKRAAMGHRNTGAPFVILAKGDGTAC